MRGQTNASNIGGNVGNSNRPIYIENGVGKAVPYDVLNIGQTDQLIPNSKRHATPIVIQANGMNVASNSQQFGFGDISVRDDNGSTVMLLRFLQQNNTLALQLIGFNTAGNEAYYQTIASFTR